MIRTDTTLARNHFNEDKNFKIRPQPPEGDQLPRESLSSFTVNLPGRNEF